MTISKRSLIATIKNGIQRLLLEGKIEGKTGHRKPRTMWMDSIKDWTGLKYGVCVPRRAEDRIEWRSMTGNPLRVDGTT